MKKDMTFSADFARCGYTKVSRQAMQIAFTPGDKCEKEAKVLLCILGFAYFKKGEVSFHFKDYACERGEWITSYSELARRTGLIRRAAVTAVGHLVEAGWLTVTAVGRMTKFTLTFYDAPPQRPVSTYPLLEGAPNDMTVNETYLWQNETEGEVSATCNEGANPLWFYSPFLFRDRENLTPGVRHTFLIAGLAYGLRRALLDEMTITEGVEYERYVAEWLAQNPGKTRLDVPQLTVDLRGARIVVPGDVASEYQIRVPVTSVEEMHIQNEKIYMLIVEFGLNTPNPLRFPLYAPERVCKIVPQAGDEIDAIIWLQGRIID